MAVTTITTTNVAISSANAKIALSNAGILSGMDLGSIVYVAIIAAICLAQYAACGMFLLAILSDRKIVENAGLAKTIMLVIIWPVLLIASPFLSRQ